MDDGREEAELEAAAEAEPQVTSADPNERKLARRLRIERRMESMRKQQQQTEGEEEVEDTAKSLLQQQLQQSAETIRKLILEGEEQITNVRVSNEVREVDRRESEGIGREKIIAKLQEEADNAQEMFNQITDKWKGILRSNDPLHIHEELENQKQKCDEVIRQKDAIIVMLKNELKNAEINFMADQRKQEDDIVILTHRIEKQIILMRRAYRRELEFIEEAISSERRALIEANDKHWEELHKKRDQEEESNSTKKLEQINEFMRILKQIRIDNEERFRETKILLEREIDDIQQELERLKNLALINSEKLDYNYQILKKREDENIIIKSQQKRRINKLQDIINSLRRKINDLEKGHVAQVEKLSDEIKKLQRSILDIESKADHFAKINDSQYLQVWDMNEERVRNLLKKIYDTDQILHEQQLGLVWEGPKKLEVVNKKDLPSYRNALQIIAEDNRVHLNVKEQEKVRKQHTKEIQGRIGKFDKVAYRRLLHHIMSRIADKTGFLVEEKLKIILEDYSDDENTLVSIDNVFLALKIKKDEDINLLLDVFLPYTYCPICSAGSKIFAKTFESEFELGSHVAEEIQSAAAPDHPHPTGQSGLISDIRQINLAVQQPGDVVEEIVESVVSAEYAANQLAQPIENLEGECLGPVVTQTKSEEVKHEVAVETNTGSQPDTVSCEYDHPLMISSVYVLKALKTFINNYFVEQEQLCSMELRLTRRRNTVSRLIREEDVTEFWGKYKAAYTNEMEQLWIGLFEGLKKYQDILKDRRKICDEVVALRTQNYELKNILAKYVHRNRDFLK